MSHYDFFQNRACEYFPCHRGVAQESFNCLFCYCPLYALGETCGGNFRYTPDGIKDCSDCTLPHRQEKYEQILRQMDKVMALAKKP